MRLRTRILALAFVALAGLGLVAAGPVTGPAMASEVKLVVDGIPITSFDIARRAALLKLQHKGGNISAEARQDMIDQALERSEIHRYHVDAGDAEVNAAFAKFAAGNHLAPQQLSTILDRAGVTADHFKEYIRTQIGWARVLQKRFQVVGMISEQDAVQRIIKNGGVKPTATEYSLQQFIFVIPPKDKKALLAKRRSQAEALRTQFSSCDTSRQLVLSKGLIDVTVRDLGQIIAPQLPPDWEKQIKATPPGHATPIRETDRGVEFIGVCSTREVSDDRVAQLVFSAEDNGDQKAKEMRDNYINELRKKARIEQR
jgi:peptidyl-prolyl cis-trans isomerase SurA